MIRLALCFGSILILAACAENPPPPATLPRPQSPIIAIPGAAPRGEPKDYINLAATDLKALFGIPAFVRKDGTVEMWRYDGQSCRAFFFLYGTPAQVRHVETLPRGPQSAADLNCLSALRVLPPRTS